MEDRNEFMTGQPPEAEEALSRYEAEGTAGPVGDGLPAAQDKEENASPVRSVLLCGNLNILTPDAVDYLARYYTVIVAGGGEPSGADRNPGIHRHRIGILDSRFGQLFDAYEIDAVVYFSGFADYKGGATDELKVIATVIEQCERFGVSKLIAVTSMESQNFQTILDPFGRVRQKEYGSQQALYAAEIERLIVSASRMHRVKCILLRAPYIANPEDPSGQLTGFFRRMREGEELLFPNAPQNQVDFLSVGDLTELLLAVLAENGDRSGEYNVSSGFHYTWEDLEQTLRRCVPELSVRYGNRVDRVPVGTYNVRLMRLYGFVPMDNVREKLGTMYETYSEGRRKGLLQRLRGAADALLTREGVLPLAELAVVAAVCEMLLRLSGVQTEFGFVDIRLFCVLIMGTTHGMRIGILAGLLECVSLYFGYRSRGYTGVMLFFNLEYWLPFVLYLMTGAITGYIRSNHQARLRYAEQDNESLREKYHFLLQVNKGLSENKGRYKRQILGYKDSFGVIFRAVQQLDSVLPQNLFIRSIQILESSLKNQSIAIYSPDERGNFARLVACSGELLRATPKSIALSEMRPMMAAFDEGGLWRNREMLPGLPMFAYAVRRGERIELIIEVVRTSADQKSLYFENLFSVICNLVRISFIRALDYQRSVERDRYYPGTMIAVPACFEEMLDVQKRLFESGLSNYALIRFASRDRQAISDTVAPLFRSADLLGSDESGQLYLLLPQIDSDHVCVATQRLDRAGVAYEVVSVN